MGSKEDWEEIERYVNEVENKKLESYKGIDITEMLKGKKSNNKIIKKIIKRISKPVVLIFATIILFIIITIAGAYLDTMKNAHNIDIKQNIESFKHIKINQISESLDEKGYNRRVSL